MSPHVAVAAGACHPMPYAAADSVCLVAVCATGCGGFPSGSEQGIKSGATVQAYRLDPASAAGQTDRPADAGWLQGRRRAGATVAGRGGPADGRLDQPLHVQDVGVQADCAFQPLVGFRYPASPHPVDVIVAFPCKEARFVRWTLDGSRPDDKDEDIAGGYYELVNVAKEAFPSDSAVQALDPGKPGGRWAK